MVPCTCAGARTDRGEPPLAEPDPVGPPPGTVDWAVAQMAEAEVERRNRPKETATFRPPLAGQEASWSPGVPRLPLIGEGTLAVLRSHGIGTARDLLAASSHLGAIPGIGPAKRAVLLGWASTRPKA